MFINIYKEEPKNIVLSYFLVLTLPIAILSPTSFINIYTILISFIFIYQLILYQKYGIFINSELLLLLLFWITLIISLFFSIDINNSISRSLGFLRFLIFIPAIIFITQYKNGKFVDTIFKFWTLIFSVITCDLIFEYFIGHNLLGFKSNMDGRLAGVLNEELKIGNYYLGFYLISITAIIKMFPNKKIIVYLAILIFTLVGFIIGERANFIRLLISLIIFFYFWKGINFKKFCIFFSFLSLLILILFNYNKDLNTRYNYQFFSVLKSSGVSNYLYKSQYGAHYVTAVEIFKNYPFTGIGLKNFDKECKNDRYYNRNYEQTKIRCATHPHQIHLEILSHAGFPAYVIFLLLFAYFILKNIKIFNKEKNLYQISSVIFIFTMIFLPLPTGSFFTSYGATILWLNFSLALSFRKN